MKTTVLHAVLIGVIAGVLFFALDSREPEPGADYIDIIDALVDAGLQKPFEFKGEEFRENRTIISMTDINATFSSRVMAQLIELDRVSSEPIDFYLRTEGGWEADAFAVIDLIRSLNSPVNIHGIGEVHSAGAMILATATGRRIVYEHTLLGFHEAGPDEEPLFETRYLDLWRKNATLPEAWLQSRDEEMRYFTAEEAVEMGVADEIAVSK